MPFRDKSFLWPKRPATAKEFLGPNLFRSKTSVGYKLLGLKVLLGLSTS